MGMVRDMLRMIRRVRDAERLMDQMYRVLRKAYDSRSDYTPRLDLIAMYDVTKEYDTYRATWEEGR